MCSIDQKMIIKSTVRVPNVPYVSRDSSGDISLGGNFVLGGSASCSTRLSLPHPTITDLDQAVEQTVDHEAVAHVHT
jgi:hypothetical protein